MVKFTSSFYLTFLVDTTNTLNIIINEPPEGKLETQKRQLQKSRRQRMYLEKNNNNFVIEGVVDPKFKNLPAPGREI